MSQTVELGLSGSEVDLPAEGRQLQIEYEEISRTRRTASGKLKKHIIGRKRIFTLRYSSATSSLFNTLTGLYETHIDTGSNLSLIYSTNTGAQQTVEVSPSPPSYTQGAPRREWLYRDFSMRLEEV